MIPMLTQRRAPRRVSHLARFAPSGDVGALWIPPRGVDEGRLARPDVAMFQQILASMGYTDRGTLRPDGIIGAHTRAAVRAFQQDMQPARLRAETTPIGERARAFHARTATLAVDGVLGPETQRWLRWFAVHTESGGGGEAVGYATVSPAPGVTPSRVSQSGGLHVAEVDPVTVDGPAPQTSPAPAPSLVILPGATAPMLTFAPPAPQATQPEVPQPPAPDAPPTPATREASQAITFTPPVPASTAQASMGSTLLVVGAVAALGLGALVLSRRH